MAVTSTVNILQESELTENFNFMKPTDFHVRIDRKRFHNLQFFANTVTHPGVSVSTPSLAIPRLQNMSVPGDTYAVDEVSMDILLDEDNCNLQIFAKTSLLLNIKSSGLKKLIRCFRL